MIKFFAIVLKTLFLLAPPATALALSRSKWRARWWVIGFAIFLVSYALLFSSLYVEYVAEMSAKGTCTSSFDGEAAVISCPPIEDHWETGWDRVKRYATLLYPILWMSALGVVAYFRHRREVVHALPPNTSLERTREG
jgi:hypothetical protein